VCLALSLTRAVSLGSVTVQSSLQRESAVPVANSAVVSLFSVWCVTVLYSVQHSAALQRHVGAGALLCQRHGNTRSAATSIAVAAACRAALVVCRPHPSLSLCRARYSLFLFSSFDSTILSFRPPAPFVDRHFGAKFLPVVRGFRFFLVKKRG